MIRHPNSVMPTQIQEWRKFMPCFLEFLPNGNYPLRPKITITPPVPGIGLCSNEDQQLFAEVDEMERNLLNTVIDAKVRDLNKDSKTKFLVYSKRLMLTGSREYTLVIMGKSSTTQKIRAAMKNLGELLEMAYDQILIPVRMVTDSSTSLTLGMDSVQPPNAGVYCLHDHNYSDANNNSAFDNK